MNINTVRDLHAVLSSCIKQGKGDLLIFQARDAEFNDVHKILNLSLIDGDDVGVIGDAICIIPEHGTAFM